MAFLYVVNKQVQGPVLTQQNHHEGGSFKLLRLCTLKVQINL